MYVVEILDGVTVPSMNHSRLLHDMTFALGLYTKDLTERNMIKRDQQRDPTIAIITQASSLWGAPWYIGGGVPPHPEWVLARCSPFTHTSPEAYAIDVYLPAIK